MTHGKGIEGTRRWCI